LNPEEVDISFLMGDSFRLAIPIWGSAMDGVVEVDFAIAMGKLGGVAFNVKEYLIPPLVLLQPGSTTAATINCEWSTYPATLWSPWAILCAFMLLSARSCGIRPPVLSSARMPVRPSPYSARCP